jgi:hypothetical protein
MSAGLDHTLAHLPRISRYIFCETFPFKVGFALSVSRLVFGLS